MPKIRNKNFAVSPAVFKDGEPELLHVDFLAKTGSHFTGYIAEEDSLRESFDEETQFFYTLENFDSEDILYRKLIQQERGLAQIKRVGKRFYLDRQLSLELIKNEEDGTSTTDDGFLSLPDETHVIVGTYIPLNYIDLFCRDNTVVCSTEPDTPSPVEIEKNSLLGRLEGEIQSINSEELGFILSPDFTVQSLQANSSPILIASDHVELTSQKSKLVANHIALSPRRSKPRNRQEGSIIYNSDKKCLEFYNGTGWVKIKTEE